MATILKNILTFNNLLVGVPVSQPHRLNVFTGSTAVPVIPNLVVPNEPGFTITADVVNVTVERTPTGGTSINVYVEHWHTIEAVLPLPGQLAGLMPFIASGGTGAAPIVPATIIVEDEGLALPGNPFTTLDFVGAGVTASDLGGGVAQISIPGSSIIVEDEGVALPGNPFTTLDFVGDGVVATDLGGGVAQLTIPGFSLARQFTVAMGGDPDYTSIKAAVNAAILAGASANSPYNVLVSAGIYVEDPFTVPAGVIVSSESSVGDGVIVIANNPAADLVTMTGGILHGLLFEGVTDPVRALIRVAAGGLNRVWACRWRRCSTGVAVSGAATILGLINCGISILAPGQHVTTGVLISAGAHVGVANFSAIVPPAIAAIYAPANAINTVISVTSAFIEAASSSINVKGTTPTQTGFLADDGAQCDLVGVEVSSCKLGIVVGSVGIDTDVRVIGGAMAGNTTNVTISSATGSVLFGNISIDADTRNIVPGGSFTGNFLNHTTGSSTSIGEQFFEWPTGQDLRLPTFFHYVSSTGIDTGGVVTATGGLGISVALGTGMITVQLPESVRNVTWATTPLVLPDNTTSYVYYDSASDLVVSGLAPPGTSNILFATIVTKAGVVFFQHNTSWTGDTAWDRWVQYLVDVRKIRVANGLIATQGSTVRNLDISNGLWYRAMTPLTYAGGADVTWSYFYGLNGVSEVPGQTLLDITNYDNAGVLTAMTPTWWRQDLLILTGDDRISVLYGVAEFATELAAQGTPSPPIPTFMEETATPLALVLVQQGLGLTKIIDVRPLDGSGSGSASTLGVTSHSALSNLLADDHPQYLRTDGSRIMTGDLQLGGNDIITVGTVNGVTVEAHAVRHAPGGADALALGVPVATLVGAVPAAGVAATFVRSDHQHGVAAGVAPVNVTKSAAVEGGSSSVARADHKHDIDTAIVVTIGTANAEGASTSLARADHVHDHGAQALGTGTQHAEVTQLIAGFSSAADKTKLDGITPGATNTPLSVVAPVNVTKAPAAVGISLSAARADHKHDVTTAAAVAVGTANAEGVATTLARSDHAHQVTGLTIAGQVRGDVLFFNGAAWVRLAPGVAGQVLQTNGPVADPTWTSSVGVFGTQFQNAESLAASSTPGAGYNNKLTMVTPALPAGSYIVEWSYTLGNVNFGASSRGRVVVDGVTTLQEVQPSNTLVAWKNGEAGQGLVVLGAGAHTIAIDYSRVSGGTATIQDARLLIWRVA